MTTYQNTKTRCRLLCCAARSKGAALVAMVLTLGVLPDAAPVHAADPPAAFAHLMIGGNYFRRDLRSSKYTILASYIDQKLSMEAANGGGGDVPAGGMAVFGWFESGEVQLLHVVEYMPSMQSMTVQRHVKPAKFPLDPKATPLYAMVCGWPLDDRRQAGKITAAYVERDDANVQVNQSSVGVLTNVRWVSVPASRAAKNFQGRDYCGELAKTRKSSAPLWLTTATE